MRDKPLAANAHIAVGESFQFDLRPFVEGGPKDLEMRWLLPELTNPALQTSTRVCFDYIRRINANV